MVTYEDILEDEDALGWGVGGKESFQILKI